MKQELSGDSALSDGLKLLSSAFDFAVMTRLLLEHADSLDRSGLSVDLRKDQFPTTGLGSREASANW